MENLRIPFDGNFPITQAFDDPRFRSNYLKFGILGHNGIDYGLPTGTPVVAPHSGTVIEAQSDPTGYGNYIKVEDGVQGSVLGHLLDFAVAVGQKVIQGQILGHSDNTGNSTGSHLHWGYYRLPRNRDNGFAGFIDQTDWLNLKIPQVVMTITDQTMLPIMDDAGRQMELQAVRSKLNDQAATIINLQAKIDDLLHPAPIPSENASGEATDDSSNSITVPYSFWGSLWAALKGLFPKK